jgi:hypothetical protein
MIETKCKLEYFDGRRAKIEKREHYIVNNFAIYPLHRILWGHAIT